MAMLGVEVFKFHKGERWFGARVRIEGDANVYQTYGHTQEEADQRLAELIRRRTGVGFYELIAPGEDLKKDLEPTLA